MSAGNVARRHTKSVYLGFQMVVLAALRARLKGWAPSGKYRLGRWGMPVNIGALVYGVAAIANVCWPRTPEAPWYDNYVVLLMSGVIISLGILYMVFSRAYANSDAPHADAIPRPEIDRAVTEGPAMPGVRNQSTVKLRTALGVPSSHPNPSTPRRRWGQESGDGSRFCSRT
ncbi:putative amino acid permease domain protein [Mycobacterium kansasii 732]|uniref:hypothetical protein n=1 Tax=Mycobacterium pseudokansasii TaxID=2341080 RepID=UPI000448C4A4|nr:hypothetical protein [Mycobacterium pseudokansasii]EUA10168.1 putative amino acid permease domain protein [Mycobacterium kansasii 732]